MAALIGFAWAIAWDTTGSIRAADWLPYALAAALMLGAVLLAGAAYRPDRLPLVAAGCLTAFAVWTAISAAWSPLPSLARDDGLLALFYAIAFLTPLVTLRSAADRVAAIAVTVIGLTTLMLWTAVRLRTGGEPDVLYSAGRLDFPVTYWNGQSAIALAAFWPGIALAADRKLHPALRAVALGGVTSMLALWIGTQSKGGGVALVVSAVVVFAVSSARLRLLVPCVIASALAALAADAMTKPYRADGEAFGRAVRHAGTMTLVVAAIGAGLGLAYALVDRRLTLSKDVRRIAGIAVATVAVVVALAGVGLFFASVDHPIRSTQTRWHDFKHLDRESTGSSHFGQLGSNRYDFWRVALDEFARHPVAGIGGRGWDVAYRAHGRSEEGPVRAHSVELDALSETGLIGALLVVMAGVLALVAVGGLARRSLLSAGALGTGVYFAVHTGGDWIWTIPAVGLPVFVIVGIGASSDLSGALPARVALPAGFVAVLAGLFAFAPPWLSARFVDRAYETGSAPAAASDLRWARRLDPLSVDPLIARSALAAGAAKLPPLEQAVSKRPRDSELYFLLGLAYLDAGRKADARRVLTTASLLYPRDEAIRIALRRAR